MLPQCKSWVQYSPLILSKSQFHEHFYRFLKCELSEALRDTLPIPCINAGNGCEAVLYAKALEEHEEFCIFRNIYCADYKCNDGPVFKDYIDHFNAMHVDDGDDLNGQKDCEVFTADFTVEKAKVGHARRFTKFGLDFFDLGFVDKGIMKRWLLFQGSSSEAKYFVYESCLTGPDGCKVTIVDQVASLDEEFWKKRPKFKLLTDFLESFAQDCGTLDYKLQIRNLKEEAAKDDDEESGVSDVESSSDN